MCRTDQVVNARTTELVIRQQYTYTQSTSGEGLNVCSSTKVAGATFGCTGKAKYKFLKKKANIFHKWLIAQMKYIKYKENQIYILLW